MVLTHQNCGKYLSQAYHEDLQEAVRDPTKVAADDLTYLEWSADNPRYIGREIEIKPQPLDPEDTGGSDINLRKLVREPWHK